jgi:HEPN domain-containing protein
MRPQYPDDAEDWIIRAERDLEVAKQMLAANPMFGDAVAYHAQQAAEKALKGFLTAYGITFRKTHLLEELIEACEMIEPQFQQFSAAAQILSPYASEFRYPGGRIEPADAEARAAYQHATDILQYVRDALANAISPQSN